MPGFPKGAKPYRFYKESKDGTRKLKKTLLIPDEIKQLNKTKSTYHFILKTVKKGKVVYLKKPEHLDDTHEPVVPFFEAAVANFFRLIDLNIAPSTHVYYDEEDKLAGVGSTDLKGFIPNKDDPLKAENLFFETLEVGSAERYQLSNMIYTYFKTHLNRDADEKAGFISRGFTYLTNTANYLTSGSSAAYVKSCLESFISKKDHFNEDSIAKLLKPHLMNRLNFIKGEIIKGTKVEQYRLEQADLEKIIQQAAEFCSFDRKTKLARKYQPTLKVKLTPAIIKQYEKLDKIYGAALDQQDNESILTETDSPFVITANDLRNYRIIRGLGVGLPASYVFKEGDCHNLNIAKNGKRIDFDMALLDISWNWKDPNLLERLGRKPDDTTFVVTPEDIKNFPNLSTAKFYYWPSKHTDVTQTMMDSIYEDLKYYISPNYFKETDNVVFKQLASHPMFIFHKFKTFLKFIMTTPTMYQQIAELHIRKDTAFNDQGTKSKNLLDTLVMNVTERIKVIRQVLINMQEFREFLTDYGDIAFDLIKEEFKEYKAKYESKLAEKPHFGPVVKSIDLEEISKTFQAIKEATLEPLKTFEMSMIASTSAMPKAMKK